MKKLLLLSLIILSSLSCNKSKETDQDSNWLPGSWGVRLIVEGGKVLDEVSPSSDWVKDAQEIADILPTVGHVFTNFTHRAHGYWFTEIRLPLKPILFWITFYFSHE